MSLSRRLHPIVAWLGFAIPFLFVPFANGDEKEMHALIAARCLECHRGAEPAGGFDLSSHAGLVRGSDSGSVFDSSNVKDSLLWHVVSSDSMPPKIKLKPDEKQLFSQWLQQGAPLPETPIDPIALSSKYRAGLDWWSLQPLRDIAPAKSDIAAWDRNAIDAFVLEKLIEQGLEPNPSASHRVWLRRVYLDLIGIPPSFDEVMAFDANPSEVAYEQIVDRLLASPAYGERWARHWLDVVRFGESDGFERNFPRRNSWPYRDWVIRALNEDMPYDEFVRMQIAGDQFDSSPDGAAAIGFLVCGLHNTVVGQSERMKRIAKQDELEDKVGTLSQAFLGLTAQCARCHEHKFDPISSRSYYQLASALQGVQHGDRDLGEGKGKMYSVLSEQNLGPTHILIRGDVFQLGDSVRAGGLVGLNAESPDFGLPDSASDGERRAALARWITTANPALLSRVLVNRVWHYHFGTGIVETPNDLGFNGGRPSHPELLDHLAARFIDEGMRLKPLHREIVLSRTYRSSSRPTSRSLAVDKNNRWLWRYPVRRLDGESVRDGMLAASGLLRHEFGGAGFQDVDVREINGTTYYIPRTEETKDCFRRTVYRFNPRCERNPILDGFDCPDPSATAPRRASTTTPLQALSLLNNTFVMTASDALVRHVSARSDAMHDADNLKQADDPQRIVREMFRSVLLRDPSDREMRTAEELVRSFGPAALARSLWNANEFLVVE
jgi:hypothetical protein